MNKNIIGLAFLAAVMLLWFLGLGPIVSVSVIISIAILSWVAEIIEPDSALKRYMRRYAKAGLFLMVAVLVTTLIARILTVPILKVLTEILDGTVLVGLSLDNIEHYLIMFLVIVLFSSFFAYMILYGGSVGKKWRSIFVIMLLIVFVSAFWQLSLKDLPLSQRLSKQIAVTLAKGSHQMGTINKEVVEVYVATYDATTETFSTIEPRDQIVKVDSPVKVKLASPIVVYADESFINILLSNDQGEFDINPSDPGVWLPVEMVTMGRRKVSQPVIKPKEGLPLPVITEKLIMVDQQDILDIVPLESVVQLKVPTVEPEKNSNVVTVTSGDWISSEVSPNHGDKIKVGEFPNKEDVVRLIAGINGVTIPNLIPMKGNDSLWYIVLDCNSGGSNKNRYPIELRLKYGLPLSVTVQKLEK